MSKTNRSTKYKKNAPLKKKNRNKSRVASSKINKKSANVKWFAYGVILLVALVGIVLIYRSYAAVKPNLRFQILKNSTCVSSVPSTDSVVHVRIYRDSGSETISNISVNINGQAVTTNPTSINGPVVNLMIASPALSSSQASHTFSVTGTKSGSTVTFSPYCEANGNTNRTINVVSTSPGNTGSGGGNSNTGNGNPPNTGAGSTNNRRLSASLTPAELAAGSVSDSGAESATINSIFAPRNATIWCNQGQCSVGYNYGQPVQTQIKPSWNCTNGSGWSYKVVSGTKAGRWLCTRDYSVESDPIIRPWLRVAACESGGNWAINTGNGFYGGLQFDLQTWSSVGGQGYPHQNSAHEQAYRAEILRSQRGTQPWPHCGRYYNG
ncbi:MAG TPA: transglycosylase family protein [Candidatus Saccharibacteria bacterium]|nr:transglycosylase family protein [Candidatus Saccharibacteria bacterium]HMT39974.1 transglycosylase family protein [Candidatus Saccharibacteria bacterium]